MTTICQPCQIILGGKIETPSSVKDTFSLGLSTGFISHQTVEINQEWRTESLSRGGQWTPLIFRWFYWTFSLICFKNDLLGRLCKMQALFLWGLLRPRFLIGWIMPLKIEMSLSNLLLINIRRWEVQPMLIFIYELNLE